MSIFTCPSVAKQGKISAIVPFASHIDSNEHSVDVVITEQGVADLRGKSPKQRAQLLIENCAHPDYRPLLREYVRLAGHKSQTPHALAAAFGMHVTLGTKGDMSLTDWNAFLQ
jgi:acyl-CoA hydrolase